VSWAKIDDNLTFHPKVLEAGNEAIGVWVRLLAWTACYMQDGRVPDNIVRSIDPDRTVIAKLVSVGMVYDKNEAGIELHDYLKFNPSKRQIEAERKKWRDKKRNKKNDKAASHSTGESTMDSSGDSPVERGGETGGDAGTGSVSGFKGGSRGIAKCDIGRLQQSWVRIAGVIAVNGLLEFATAVEIAAAAKSPPVDPNEYAERLIKAFCRWVDSIENHSKRPGKAPFKLLNNWERIQKIVDGKADMPRPSTVMKTIAYDD
jgi:hypothetical protein